MRALLVSGIVAVGYSYNANRRHLSWPAIIAGFEKVVGGLPVYAGRHEGPAVGRTVALTRDDAREELHAVLLITDAKAAGEVKSGHWPALSLGYLISRAEERSGGLLHVSELEATDIALSPIPSSPRCLVSDWREVELPATAMTPISKGRLVKAASGTSQAGEIDSRIAADLLRPIAKELDTLASRVDRLTEETPDARVLRRFTHGGSSRGSLVLLKDGRRL
jgi:hypothetical protein